MQRVGNSNGRCPWLRFALPPMQAMGAEGFRDDYPLIRHMAGAKMAQYLDGTTEIQNVVISRDLFNLK
jgi:alkylation response protein AidB-like acyl-CoA dehydrogenase